MRKIFFLIAMFSINFIYAQWQIMNCPASGIGRFLFSGTKIFVGTYNGVYLSIDNGVTWNQQNNGLTNLTVQSLAICDSNIFAGTFGGGIYSSSNNGSNWIQVNNGLTCAKVPALAADSTSIFAGTFGGGMFLSTNKGSNWNAINNGLPDSLIGAVLINGSNIFIGTRLNGVYLSTNNGSNWYWSSNGITHVDIFSLAFNDSGVYAGTGNHGVFVTIDNGLNWNAINSGLTNTVIESLHTIKGTNIILAGTFGGGVFISTNNGSNWMPFNNGLSDNIIWHISSNEQYIFASGQNYLYRIPLSEIVNIEEKEWNNIINIWPNPANFSVTVETTQTDKLSVLFVCNSNGQEIFRRQIKENKAHIDISNLACGVYFLKLITENTVVVRKLIKE